MWYSYNFSNQVLLLGNAPQFFVRGKNLKLYNGAYGFFNEPKVWHAQRKIREIVIYLCIVGAGLMGRSYFRQNHHPIFPEAKKRKFYNGANRHFLICFLNSEKPANGGRAKQIIAMSHIGFSLMQVLVLGDPPQFLQGQKLQFSATFSTTFGIGGLLLQNWEKYWKSKTAGFISDYLTIFTPNLVVGWLNSHGEKICANRGGASHL